MKILFEITFNFEASNKNFLVNALEFFNGCCNVSLILCCDIYIVIKCFCSYVSRWSDYRWQRTNFDWIKLHTSFFRRCGHPQTHTQVSEDFKTPINSPSNIILEITCFLDANWKIKSSILQESVRGSLEKFSELKVL